MNQPLLSICVPTYNRADRLRVMLQALLPQIAEHSDRVELWISDNASTDETPRVIEEARRLGPLNYSRNDTNLGIIGNVIKLMTELARGEFVWGLGDDDLIRPDAVRRVIETVEANRHLNLFYLNFRLAFYSQHWPAEAHGGYEGPFTEPANADLSDHPLKHWRDVVSGSNCSCTQFYSYLVRRSVWQDYWQVRPRQEDFSDPRWSYPHSYMVAETLMNDPSYYVGDPVVTIFNGAQSWLGRRFEVVFNAPGLVRAYQKGGLPKEQVRDCARNAFTNCEPLLVEALRREAGPRLPILTFYLRKAWRFREGWIALARASLTAGTPWPVSQLCRAAVRVWPLLDRARGKIQFERSRLKAAIGGPR
jgi:glycosyltransferase involved in cell wall biosynthesis